MDKDEKRLEDEILRVVASGNGTPVELQHVIFDVRLLSQVAGQFTEKEIVMAVHDLLDFNRLVLTGDRRLRLP